MNSLEVSPVLNNFYTTPCHVDQIYYLPGSILYFIFTTLSESHFLEIVLLDVIFKLTPTRSIQFGSSKRKLFTHYQNLLHLPYFKTMNFYILSSYTISLSGLKFGPKIP
jgi:hypothetical protein